MDLELRILPLVHHALHATPPAAVLVKIPPMVPQCRAAAIMILLISTPARALLAFEVTRVPVMMRAQQPREFLKPRLLRITEACIKWLAGVGDALERSALLRHVVGVLPQPVEGCARRLVGVLLGRFARGDSLGPQLRHVAQGLLKVRPVLGLIGRKLKAGFERGNAGIDECRSIFRAQPMPVLEARAVSIRPVEMLLGQDD